MIIIKVKHIPRGVESKIVVGEVQVTHVRAILRCKHGVSTEGGEVAIVLGRRDHELPFDGGRYRGRCWRTT